MAIVSPAPLPWIVPPSNVIWLIPYAPGFESDSIRCQPDCCPFREWTCPRSPESRTSATPLADCSKPETELPPGLACRRRWSLCRTPVPTGCCPTTRAVARAARKSKGGKRESLVVNGSCKGRDRARERRRRGMPFPQENKEAGRALPRRQQQADRTIRNAFEHAPPQD